jgi:F-type H+-transporting ATPase subunit b
MSAVLRRLGWLALAALAVASPALAAEEGGDPAFSPIGWVFRGINFVILVGLGYWMLRKAPQWFRGRAAKIVAAIEDSRLVKQEADQLLGDSERRLAGLVQEVAQVRTAAQQDAAAETQRIRATAKEEEAKVERAADAEIIAAERAARLELKALVAQLAVQRAEALLKEQVTPERQAALMRGFVQNLGSVN